MSRVQASFIIRLLGNGISELCFNTQHYFGLQQFVPVLTLAWYSFRLRQDPMLSFGSIVAAHRPLDTQTALGGRSHEAVFVGIAPQFAAGILLFNPVTKRYFIRHSFKYLSDIEPISTLFVVVTTPSPNNYVLTGPISENLNISPISIAEDLVEDDLNHPQPSPDYTYIHLPIFKAPANIRFAYAHLGNTFQEANTKTSYRLHDRVKL